jgi:hypothetical protein
MRVLATRGLRLLFFSGQQSIPLDPLLATVYSFL